MIEVSSTTGEGLDQLRDAIAEQVSRVRLRPVDGAARLPIDRAFSMKGFGTVVTGTLVAGRIAVDDELGGAAARPCRQGAACRSMASRHPKRWPASARRSIWAASMLREVTRGETVLARDTLGATRRVDVEVDVLPTAKPLKHGARVRLTTARRKCWAGSRSPARRSARSRLVRPRSCACASRRRQCRRARSIHHPGVFTAMTMVAASCSIRADPPGIRSEAGAPASMRCGCGPTGAPPFSGSSTMRAWPGSRRRRSCRGWAFRRRIWIRC